MTTVNKNTSGWNGDNRDPWGGSSNNQRQPNFENPFDGFQKNLNRLIPGGGKGKRGFFTTMKSDYVSIEILGLYWHFVDLVWVFIFAFFYLW